jgi:hypothetical protein
LKRSPDTDKKKHPPTPGPYGSHKHDRPDGKLR